jgi:hypothetical protein
MSFKRMLASGVGRQLKKGEKIRRTLLKTGHGQFPDMRGVANSVRDKYRAAMGRSPGAGFAKKYAEAARSLKAANPKVYQMVKDLYSGSAAGRAGRRTRAEIATERHMMEKGGASPRDAYTKARLLMMKVEGALKRGVAPVLGAGAVGQLGRRRKEK